jgi:predicted P-loop ATPase
LADYFGVDDFEYTSAVSAYMWTAMAGRVLSPGIKADMAPILIGEQGAKKSSSIEALVPSHEFFTEMDIDERRESDNSRKMRGVLVAELAELKGLRNREAEYVKAFISRTHEEWVPKFREFATKFPRRLIFIGTTNEFQFLNDDTGNRRFLPVVTKVVDIEGIKNNRDQLWAEARDLFLATGIAYQEAERLAKFVHAQHMLHEPWTDDIRKWLDTEEDFGITPRQREMLMTGEVMREALRLDVTKKDRWAEMRVGKALVELGYQRVKRRIEGKPSWVYVPT